MSTPWLGTVNPTRPGGKSLSAGESLVTAGGGCCAGRIWIAPQAIPTIAAPIILFRVAFIRCDLSLQGAIVRERKQPLTRRSGRNRTLAAGKLAQLYCSPCRTIRFDIGKI
jgi:hypothetical protein